MGRRYDASLRLPGNQVILAALAACLIAAIGAFYVRLAFDADDLDVYFASSNWVVGKGRLYDTVPSEYPLLANVIFAATRCLGNLLSPQNYGFYVVWIVTAWFVYLYALYRVARDTTMLATVAWLAPAPIYYALLRFDIYPAVATLMALFAIQRTNHVEGALWLGIAIALKGYTLFLLPAYCIFVLHQRGLVAAIKIAGVALAPMLLCLLSVLVFVGWDGVLAPFRFHAVRDFNGESTYDAITYLFGTSFLPRGAWARRIAQVLQIVCALGAAAMLPRSFEELVNALLFALLGFMSFSVFYSPQYVLWILPLACFSRSRSMLISAILFSWLTYLYFPATFDHGAGMLQTAIVAIAMLRLWMMLLSWLCSPETRQARLPPGQ
jgi:uncharacterized membrane protein